jgi:hypothetical protein
VGKNLFTVTLCSLLLLGVIDVFVSWYKKFLSRWMPNYHIRVLLIHSVWALLAILFWNTLYRNHLPDSFSLTYLFFVSFIYSVRGLAESFIKGRAQQISEQ